MVTRGSTCSFRNACDLPSPTFHTSKPIRRDIGVDAVANHLYEAFFHLASAFSQLGALEPRMASTPDLVAHLYLARVSLAASLAALAVAWPQAAGLSSDEVDLDHLARIHPALVYPEPPPGPLEFDGTKLVNDAGHPWRRLRPGDVRGPCPALNTLASHGYLPRDGVVTPSQLVSGVMEGLNMNNNLAIFVTYAAMLVDGNLITNKLSIGGKTWKTGYNVPGAGPAGGLSTPGFGIEGDASIIRGDAFFGDNHSFNQTLWNEFVDYSNRFGGGFYNFTVAGELRHRAIQRSIATNPNFTFVSPRYFNAFAESGLIVDAFLDGRNIDAERKVSMDVALGFFRDSRMPVDFHRSAKPVGNDGVPAIFAAHPIAPGRNVNGVNTYTPDPTSATLSQFCLMYENFVNRTVKSLYPNPKGVLKRNLILNLEYLYSGQPSGAGCQRVSPYGQLSQHALEEDTTAPCSICGR